MNHWLQSHSLPATIVKVTRAERCEGREPRYATLRRYEGRFTSIIAIFLSVALGGCSAQLVEPPQEQGTSRAIDEQDRKPSSIPTFTYRPGAGLIIEGR
jgi:hypothetical protein